MARKILLADDSVTAQNMGRRILVDAGYEVVTVNNGSAALKKIAELEPELVVLDVYMPGYSGLEVCQRIKAAPETATIPVLLTVGKLEPFKAEEAKKVFADAFIIKPFEATELLAALTKLEDMIVPHRNGKVSAAKSAPAPAKESAKKEKPQEDQEWKDRLRIQATPVRIEEPEAPAPIPTQFHDIRHEIAAAETDEAIARNLPGNVTSEELAAITAAVTAFSSESQAAYEPAEFAVDTQAEQVEEVEAYSPAPEPQLEEKVNDAGENAEAEVAVTRLEDSELFRSLSPWANPELLAEVAAALEPPVAELPVEPEVAAVEEAPTDTFSDSEVDAALASLTPIDDIMSRLHAEEQAHARSLDEVDAQAPAAWTDELATIASAKWIAQEVELEAHEASMILEEEMHKALAAQAEEAARAASMEIVAEENYRSIEAAAEVPEIQDAAPVDAVSAVEVPQTEEFVAEVASAAVEEETNSYAAAAAASASAAPAYSDLGSSSSATETVSEPEVKQEDSELAEAWARWRQIRESVASPQFVEQVADVAAAEISESTQASSEPAAEAEASPANESAATPDSAAIASIVDSVLADLRPRLVAEIAKKMSEKK